MERSYEGILSTGMMAIGGETTGVILKTNNGEVYELDLGRIKELEKAAQALSGKSVVVVGVYKPREGVEVKERRIIEVKTLSGTK